MALMDLMGLGADKQAVILDVGTAFTKIGFAGENAPRHIIRTEIHTVVDGELKSINIFEDRGLDENQRLSLYKEFFHMIYFKYLLVNPKERRVVLCESMLKSIDFRDTMVKILFKYFEVVSVVCIPTPLLALFATGLHTGLIVDCGYLETTVVPIYQQIPILSGMEYIDLAGKAVHEGINKQIMERAIVYVKGEEKSAASQLKLTEKILEDIKVRCCFVGRRSCDLVAVPTRYPVDCDKQLHIDGRLRAHSMDILFEMNDEDQSVATVVLNAIKKCPIDCRKELAQNIVLVGGTTMSPGFGARLFSELKELLQTERYQQKLFVKKIAFREPPVPANYCVWEGAALFGGLEILSDHSTSRERYNAEPTLPDWSNMLTIKKGEANKSAFDDKYKWTSLRKSLSASPSPSVSISSPSSISERIKKELGLTK